MAGTDGFRLNGVRQYSCQRSCSNLPADYRVRAERVQDITEEDAKAEGCHERLLNDGWKNTGKLTARDDFIMLWEYLNAKRGYSWDTNPWVWVIEFERVEKP